MARPQRPWYREAKDSWWAWIDGRQRSLGVKGKGKAAEAKAWARLRELADQVVAPAPAAVAVGELAVRFLAASKARLQRGELERTTLADYARRLDPFVSRFGDHEAASLVPGDVLAAFDELDLSPTTRADYVAAAKALMRWGRAMGYLATDPLATLPVPRRGTTKRPIPTADELAKVFGAIRSEHFRDLLRFVWSTGCRPLEAARLEAHHVDLAAKVATLPGKTTRKTGRPIRIVLPDSIMPLVSRLVRERPIGPLLPNEDGRAWTKDAINCQVVRLRRRAGVGSQFFARSLRAVFATDALGRGVPIATVAELLNHADTRMVSRHYSRLGDRLDHLRDAANTVRDSA